MLNSVKFQLTPLLLVQHACQEPIDASDTCDSQVQRLKLCHTDTVDVAPSSAKDPWPESMIEKMQ